MTVARVRSRLLAVYGWMKRVSSGFMRNNCTLHAAGLTYFSILALIPVLCCILVAAKACDLDDLARQQINFKIDSLIAGIERGQEDGIAKITATSEDELERRRIAAEEFAKVSRAVSNQVFGRISRYDVSTFGWIGFGFLLWMVISSLGMVEVSLNQIWGGVKPRPVWKRACVYLSLAVALPVLATLAMSFPLITVCKNVAVSLFGASALTRWLSDSVVWLLDSKAVGTAFSLFSASLTFTFFYWVVPNCRVRFRHAFYGGAITSLLFGAWIKACAVAQVGIARSSMLYGSFAFLPIVLAWIYVSWQIVLLGANMVREFGRAGEDAAVKP